MIRVFIHIPKCGGSTIRDTMLASHLPNEVIRVYGDYGAANKSMSIEQLRVRFNNKVERDLNPPKAIVGHIEFSAISGIFPESELDCFTFVRDPIERGISNVNYMKLMATGQKREWASKINSKNLLDHLTRPINQNYQFNYLGGNIGLSIDAILSKIKVFHLSNYREALVRLGYVDNPAEIKIKNTTAQNSRQSGDDKVELLSLDMLSETDIRKLREFNSLDYELIKQIAVLPVSKLD